MSNSSAKSTLVSTLVLLSLFITVYSAGTITAYTVTDIDASIANLNQNADYTFNFYTTTAVPSGGILVVTFPTQYTSGLGISTASCSVPCTVSSNAVTLTFNYSVAAATLTTVTIYGVLNPSSQGGTGNFQLQTYKGVNLLDENLIFGVMGIAGTVGALTSTIVSVDSTGLSNAGETTRYNFQFKVSQLIPAGSYIKLTISDSNFVLSPFPACNPYSISGVIIQGKFYCETDGNDILVRGLTVDIAANQYVGMSVAMTNPPYAGTSDKFTIAVLRGGTNLIYDVKSSIAGVTIAAGLITSISLTPVDSTIIQSQNKLQDYILTFQLKNGLSTVSVIALQFPPSFAIDTNLYATTSEGFIQVQKGLDDISATSTVGISVDSLNVLRLTNFRAFSTPQAISVYVRLTNPSNVGDTTPVTIVTYKDALQTITVDSDSISAYTEISSYTSPTTHAIQTSSVTASTTIANMVFTIQPTTSVPEGGVIQITVPSDFTVSTVSTSSCQIAGYSAVFVAASACSNVGNVITLTLPTTQGFPIQYINYFRIQNVITTPTYNKTYLFDMVSYMQDGSIVIESWSDYLIVTPSAFSSSSVSSLDRYQNRKTVLTFSFLTALAIPAGIAQNKATDTKGFLEFVFTNAGSSLGFGLTSSARIPCYVNSGLTTITGVTVNCTLYPISTTVAIVRVDNFQAIAASTTVSISFPGVTNPTASFTCKMKTISLANRVRTEINSVTLTVTVSTVATAMLDATLTSTTAPTLSSYYVATTTNMILQPNIAVNINGATNPGAFLIQLPYYDIGWIPSSDSVVCKIGSSIYSCTRYYGADYIKIPFTSGTYSAGTTIEIDNLVVPRYTLPSSSMANVIVRYITTAATQQVVYKSLAVQAAATVPTFTSAVLVANKKNKGAVNVQYTISFVAPNDIPSGSSLSITLPSAYNLLSSSPAATFSSDLTAISGQSSVSYSASLTKLIVSGFQTVSAGTSFSIIISGLKNPSSLSISQTWVGEITYSGYDILYHSAFDAFVFTSAVSANYITYNSISAFPLNADEDALYTINFVPTTTIPAGGSIQVTFPSNNYNDLPTPPVCTVTGGITTFTSCTLSGTTYTIVLDTAYSSGGIILTIDDILNPDKSTTDGFIIQTYYDGVMLDNTDTSTTTSRTVTLVDDGDSIIINSYSCDPTNEGEPANYTISFVTSNEITSTMEIHFVFPAVYDELLGSSIACASVSGLLGDTITCTVSDRTVILTGFDDYLPDTTNPIIVSIFGVVNPNVQTSTTGYMMIGTLETGTSYYVDYNTIAAAFTPTSAPGWAVLYEVTAENVYTRLDADYTFNFTVTADIPKTSSSGAILVDFPTLFSISDTSPTCDINTTDFSPSITCAFTRNRLIVQGQTQDYTGNVKFMLRNMVNPIDEGIVNTIFVKTYDGVNKLIIQRSFRNLDPFTFTFVYPGPLITINNNEAITTIRGTRTTTIPITMVDPCALNLTLKSFNPGFSVIPFGVELSLGETSATMVVSVPESFPTGTYTITWITLGDIIPAYYTPIKDTSVIVTEDTAMVVTVPTLNAIPFGGNSLPAAFTVNYGPDIDIQITINFLVTYTGMSLSTNTITFNAGNTSASFVIYCDSATASSTLQKGTLVLSLTGINADLYSLSASTLEFTIGNPDVVAPYVTSITSSSITQNSATIIINTSENCMLYYILALHGTVIPSITEAMNLGPAPYTTTQSQYGVVQVNTSATYTIVFNNLVAETPYAFYVYLVDASNNTNEATPASVNFTTVNRYNAADFSIKFLLFELSQEYKDRIIEAVSFTISLWAGKLTENIYSTTQNARLLKIAQEEYNETASDSEDIDGLSSSNQVESDQNAIQVPAIQCNERALVEDVFILMNVEIAATPESSTYPSPLTLALSLNDKITQLHARLPDVDKTFEIQAFEFVRYQPAFPTPPRLKSVGADYASFTGKLNNYGYIFVSCVPVANDHGIPSPYQIIHGFDNRNLPMASGNVEISVPYQSFTLQIDDLEPTTNYTAYIIGGSTHPGYPDPMDASKIVQIKFTTGDATIIAHLNIKSGSIVQVAYTAIIALVTFCFLM